MINKALNEKPVILQKKGTYNETEIIEIVKGIVREELKTCKNCYQVITSKLRVTLKEKYSDEWDVLVGIQDSCDADFLRVRAVFYLDFTLGKLLIRLSSYK
jgi:RNA polymerase subunit RPABC4/transcription elongation factor Spt4